MSYLGITNRVRGGAFRERVIVNLLNLLFIFNFVVDGNFSEWSSWTSCSVSCSEGVRTRERTCTNPPPVNAKNCTGSYADQTGCNEGPCPDVKKFYILLSTFLFFSFSQGLSVITLVLTKLAKKPPLNKNDNIETALFTSICLK